MCTHPADVLGDGDDEAEEGGHGERGKVQALAGKQALNQPVPRDDGDAAVPALLQGRGEAMSAGPSGARWGPGNCKAGCSPCIWVS